MLAHVLICQLHNEMIAFAQVTQDIVIYVDGQICFHRGLLADPVDPQGCTTKPVEPLRGFIRMHVVPNCCEQQSCPIL